MNDLHALSDEDLIALSRRETARQAACRDVLFERCYPKVARWCLRVCGDRETAADIAQEVMLRVHTRLDSFRAESRFSTWLYTVTRRTAIDLNIARKRRESPLVDEDQAPVARESAPGPADQALRHQVLTALRTTMKEELEPLEAETVYLHYIDGMTLPAITKLLDLHNKSGAKAFLVGGMRKLRRHFGPWLESHASGEQVNS